MSELSDRTRREFTQNDDIRDAGLTTPADIIRYDDIVYGEDPAWQSLDVYRPKNAEGQKLPVIVSVHGGGWVYGDKERYQFYCMNLAQRGFAVVNFTYRLAPEHKFPCNLEDTNGVFTWVLENGEKFGFDTRYVFGVGDSAGGSALGLYAAMCTNPEYAAKYDFKLPDGFVPTAVALNCGVFHIGMREEGDEMLKGLMMEYLPGHGTEEEIHLMNVAEHITKKYPPTFIMTCQGDFLKGHAGELADKLAKKEIPFIYRMYGDHKAPLTHVFHCDIMTKEAKLCNDEECNFFRTFVKE
ncbi:MAG: alpha/beta hydrolase [Lachnospiraceae bacterium]|nr:alpha/beta hydrolase [Lachnospiraceae bacterium]